MKKLSMIFGVAAMVLFAACSKEGPANSVRKVVLNASMEENEATKTSLDETTGAVTWKLNDQIKVVDDAGNQLTLKATVVNGKSAKFEGEIPDEQEFGTIKYAFYPASKFTVSGGNITVTPMGSSPYNSLEGQIPSFANVIGGSAVFTNLFGILRMDLRAGTFDETGRNLAFKVSSPNNVFGSYSLEIDGPDYTLSPSACVSNISWETGAFAGVTDYFIVPEGAFKDVKFTFEVTPRFGASLKKSVTSTVEIKRKYLVTLPALTISCMTDMDSPDYYLKITK